MLYLIPLVYYITYIYIYMYLYTDSTYIYIYIHILYTYTIYILPEKGWNESQRLFCDSRMSGTEPTNDPMVRNGNIALLAKWAVEPKTRL